MSDRSVQLRRGAGAPWSELHALPCKLRKSLQGGSFTELTKHFASTTHGTATPSPSGRATSTDVFVNGFCLLFLA